jgi:hypothetical protein
LAFILEFICKLDTYSHTVNFSIYALLHFLHCESSLLLPKSHFSAHTSEKATNEKGNLVFWLLSVHGIKFGLRWKEVRIAIEASNLSGVGVSTTPPNGYNKRIMAS